MKRNFKQMMMSNGDEIICEVMAQEGDEIIARKCLRVVSMDLSPRAIYYSFKPWMMMKEDVNDPISINAFHTIGICIPDSKMLKQYRHACKAIRDSYREAEETEYIAKYEQMHGYEYDEEDTDDDDEESNVVPLFDRDKLH